MPYVICFWRPGRSCSTDSRSSSSWLWWMRAKVVSWVATMRMPQARETAQGTLCSGAEAGGASNHGRGDAPVHHFAGDQIEAAEQDQDDGGFAGRAGAVAHEQRLDGGRDVVEFLLHERGGAREGVGRRFHQRPGEGG